MTLVNTKMKVVQTSFKQELTNMLADLQITIPENNVTEVENTYTNLSAILPNSVTVKHVLKTRESVEVKKQQAIQFKRFLNVLKAEWDKGYTIVTLGQIVSLCKKYNLVLAPAETFTGDIPEYHADIIEKYVAKTKKADYDWRCFKEDKSPIEDFYGFDAPYNCKLSICADVDNLNLEGYGVANGIAIPDPPIKIIPPPVVDRDPIVLHRIPDICGIHVYRVITAWDIEGSDILLQARNKNAN